jgi:hypothetical protein
MFHAISIRRRRFLYSMPTFNTPASSYFGKIPKSRYKSFTEITEQCKQTAEEKLTVAYSPNLGTSSTLQSRAALGRSRRTNPAGLDQHGEMEGKEATWGRQGAREGQYCGQ